MYAFSIFFMTKCIQFAYFISLSGMVDVVAVVVVAKLLLELTGCKDVD